MQSDRELSGGIGGGGGDGWPMLDLQGLERVFGKMLFGTPMRMARVWSLSLSKACVVVLQNTYTGHGEVLWMSQSLLMQEEKESTSNPGLWAVNRNNCCNSLLEDESFVLPPALLGDASLPVAATNYASVLVVSCCHVACAAVILRHRHVLFLMQMDC